MKRNRRKKSNETDYCRKTQCSGGLCRCPGREWKKRRIPGGKFPDRDLVYWPPCILAEAGAYEERYKKWNYEDLPILPKEWKYLVASGKEKQFSVLKSLMERTDVTEIVNGCDAGREGELIFRLAVDMAGCRKPGLPSLDFLYGGYRYP